MRRILSHVRWAWLPAAIVYAFIGWSTLGPLITLILLVAGRLLGYCVERRARRRRGRAHDQ
jgi:Flp pilus assembly protein TadB